MVAKVDSGPPVLVLRPVEPARTGSRAVAMAQGRRGEKRLADTMIEE
jgi:hypothetical protein